MLPVFEIHADQIIVVFFGADGRAHLATSWLLSLDVEGAWECFVYPRVLPLLKTFLLRQKPLGKFSDSLSGCEDRCLLIRIGNLSLCPGPLSSPIAVGHYVHEVALFAEGCLCTSALVIPSAAVP